MPRAKFCHQCLCAPVFRFRVRAFSVGHHFLIKTINLGEKKRKKGKARVLRVFACDRLVLLNGLAESRRWQKPGPKTT